MSTDTNPLERVARAIADNETGSWEGYTWDGLSEAGREKFRSDARAALSALLPVSEEVVGAMQREVRDDLEPTDDELRSFFTAAINHILKGGE